MMMVPGIRVVPCDRNAIVCRTLKIWSLSREFAWVANGKRERGHIRSATILNSLTVYYSLEGDFLRIGNRVRGHEARAEGCGVVYE